MTPLIHSIWTAMLLVIFVGIVFWTYVLKRKSDFDDVARLPLEDDDPTGDPEERIDG